MIPEAARKYVYHEEPGIVLLHGDSLEILPLLEPGSVDLVLTDPPYGVTQNRWDLLKTTQYALDMLIGKPIVCTSQNPASAELITRYSNYFKWSDVWEKSHAVGFLNCKIMPLRKHEDILVFAHGKITYNPQIKHKATSNIRPHGKTGASSNYGTFKETRERSIALDETYPMSIVLFDRPQNNYHPNEKPVELMEYLMATYSNFNNLILDPFLGSGTTAVAAKNLGRKCIGIEIHEPYLKIAVERLRQEVLL